MKKFRHIDTSGLPKGFDVADLVDSGITGDELIAWLKSRVRDGPPGPGSTTKPKVTPPKKKKKTAAKKKKTAGGATVTPMQQPDPEPEPFIDIPPEFSEDSLAEAFTKAYKDDLVYCKLWGGWLNWKGNRWKQDETGLAFDLSRRICRAHASEVETRFELGNKRTTIAGALSRRNTMSNVEKIASTDRRHAVHPNDFDSDPWALNTPDGVVDLKTGEMRSPDRREWHTKQTTVAPSNDDHPTWTRFLQQITEGDEDLASYLQRVAGYCLTGSISEQVFFFAYGGGGNGKGTFMNQLLWTMNDYAKVAQTETFMKQRFQKHAAEIAFFQGARIITASEISAGSLWNEERVKQMTGGDPITANRMRENPFTFLPTFKLLFAGNNKPHLKNVDAAMKRRLFLIPFDYQIPDGKRDGDLGEKLRAEGPAILRWFIEGCIDWQKNSLDPPDRVIASTQDYFDSEDKMAAFLAECCEEKDDQCIRTTFLLSRYCQWAEKMNDYQPNYKVFLDMMATKGYRPIKRGGESVFEGIYLPVNPDYLDDDRQVWQSTF